MKLIPMTDFVLNNKNKYYNDFYREVNYYANFLKQPLKLEMFVPCNEDGEILNPEYVGGKEVIYDSSVQDAMMDKVLEYQKAKEKVLFEGFEWKKSNFSQKPMFFLIYKQVYFLYNVEDRKFENDVDEFMETIEDLVRYNLDLAVSF
jgi:hypothetical protein